MPLRDLINNITCEGDINILVHDGNGNRTDDLTTRNYGGGFPSVEPEYLDYEVTHIYPRLDVDTKNCWSIGTVNAVLVIEITEG